MQRIFDEKYFNNDWLNSINPHNFEERALGIFYFQQQNNALYKAYTDSLNINLNNVSNILDIPFLPIHFFKTHVVKTTDFETDLIFESSGTTNTQNSKHYIKNYELYKTSFLNTFNQMYGNPQEYIFLCLLPNYLERKNSSLVYMANELIRLSKYEESGFFLNEWEDLANRLRTFSQRNDKVILLGVTFALLDFATAYPMDLSNIIVMETGGMKGRKEEWTREQIHGYLKEQWQLKAIHSEYGMTELLSQAYAPKDGIYTPANCLKVLVREEFDPLTTWYNGRGVLNLIDLANVFSCSFIATEDLGKVNTDGSFEVFGRMDNSTLRGCSLMAV